MTQPQRLTFKPHARLLTMLGDQLIKNERIALVEIIKNAYDADASWVKVTFEGFGEKFKVDPHKSKIIVEDDGTGMTRSILENHLDQSCYSGEKSRKGKERRDSQGQEDSGRKGHRAVRHPQAGENDLSRHPP